LRQIQTHQETYLIELQFEYEDMDGDSLSGSIIIEEFFEDISKVRLM